MPYSMVTLRFGFSQLRLCAKTVVATVVATVEVNPTSHVWRRA